MQMREEELRKILLVKAVEEADQQVARAARCSDSGHAQTPACGTSMT